MKSEWLLIKGYNFNHLLLFILASRSYMGFCKHIYHTPENLFSTTSTRGTTEHDLDFTIKHKHEGRSHSTKGIGSRTLEEGNSSLLGDDLAEAIHGSLVLPLGLGLLGLHLQTTTDGVEGVGHVGGSKGSGLSASKLGDHSADGLLLLVRVEAVEGVVHTEVGAAEGNDTHHRHAESVVKGQDSLGSLGGLHEAVSQAAELLLASANIGGEAGTGIVKGIDDAERSGTSKTTRQNIDNEKASKFSLGVESWKKALNGVLEGEVEGLSGKVSDDVYTISSPERSKTLLSVHTGKAVGNTSVTRHFARNDAGVSILSLDNQLYTLNGSSASLSDGTRYTTSCEVDKKVGFFSHDTS